MTRACSRWSGFSRGIEGIALIYLTGSDVIRHRLVKDIIRAYARDEGAEEG